MKLWRFILGLSFVGALMVSSAFADEDHEQAYQALRQGAIKPLSRILDVVARTVPGEVIEVELERKSEAWVYEIKILDDQGRRKKILINAATEEILAIKDKSHAHPDRGR